MSKEQMPNMQPNSPSDMSRRDFIKKMGAGVLGSTLLGRERKDSEVEKQSKQERVKQEIEKCRLIVKNERYEEILENPYLVSALYYSEEAVESMNTEGYASEEIIKGIYPHITRRFREGYLNFLQQLTEERMGNETTNLEAQSLPLDSIRAPGSEYSHPDALDLFTGEGLDIYSISSGVVVLAENGWREEDELTTTSVRGGNTVIIFNPEDESFYRYAHMKESSPSAGMILSSGETIGKVGNTGINASEEGHGEHLHLEMNKYNRETGEMKAISASDLQEKLRALQG